MELLKTYVHLFLEASSQRSIYDNRIEWTLNGKRHRVDGPAVEWKDGTKYWYQNGEFHREDGPAIEYANGKMLWFLNGEQISEDNWLEKTNAYKIYKIYLFDENILIVRDLLELYGLSRWAKAKDKHLIFRVPWKFKKVIENLDKMLKI